MQSNRGDIYGIGIESSCDESSIAIVKNGREVIANPIFSQIPIHAKYGGIIPEKASRAHLEKLPILLQECLRALPKGIKSLSYIAVTVKPGLAGSLLVGYNTALAISLYTKLPLIPVHHLEAHLSAILLENQTFSYPGLGVILSGGNSAIYDIRGISQIKVLAETKDDSAGEALDKASAMLNLTYPGGPEIEKRADLYLAQLNLEKKSAKKNPFPRILRSNTESDIRFSFSGIKTALLNLLKSNDNMYSTNEICYFYQQRIIEHIAENLSLSLNRTGYKTVIAAGGVMANAMLRKRLMEVCTQSGALLLVPSPIFCTDNAAMVASCGFRYFENGNFPGQFFVESDNKFIFTPERELEG